MRDNIRELRDDELDIVSGGGANIVRATSPGCTVEKTTITGITGSGQLTFGTTTFPCGAGEATYSPIPADFPSVQDMMGGDSCD
jgi:hypothetical protein